MKKLLAILLALVFVFALSACGEDETKGDGSSTPDVTSETSTSSEEATSSNVEVSSTTSTTIDNSSKAPATTTSTPAKPSSSKPTVSKNPTTPTTLNPKTNLKLGKYEAKYVDGNTYVVCALEIDKCFDEYTLLLNKCVYYNKQGAIDRLGSMDMTFDEADWNKITVGGVDYFNLEDFSWTTCADAIDVTDTSIKISSDYETWTNFTLLPNYSLKQENAPEKRYAKAGTIFTYKG